MSRRVRLDVDGVVVDLDVRRSPRARRILLKVDPRLGAQLVIPRGVSRREALSFAAGKAAWLRDRLARLPPRVPFRDGAVVPVLGRPCRIRRTAETDLFRAGVRREAGELLVACHPDDVPARVGEWFRDRAHDTLARRAVAAADRIGAEVARVGVRDPRTRWGSCSAAGALSFSWRLFMAPEWVMDYVVAHEVAHLLEMNHGQAFWRRVESLVDRVDDARSWLRRSGPDLHRYG